MNQSKRAKFLSLFYLLFSVFSVFRGYADDAVTLTDDGVWCWFADPRAICYEGQRRATYVGWVTRAGDIAIGCYDHDSRAITTATLKAALQRDDHANPGLLFLRDGRLMAFYSAHGGKSMFYRVADRPEDIASWGAEQTIPTNTPGKSGYTYPNPVRLNAESDRIYLFWRGGDFKPNIATSDDGGAHWTTATQFIASSGARPYVKYESNGADTIHFAFTDGHPRNETQNSIYYAAYRGGALYKADGSRIKGIADLPLQRAEVDKVYDGAAGGGRAWIWDIAFDRAGAPVIVYSALPQETDHRYRYARWDGRRWADHEIVAAGKWFPQTPPGKKESEPHYSGGVVLDHAHPDVVYLSRPVNGVFEIERWTTTDGGATWTSRPVTAGSKQNNVRPVVPRRAQAGGARPGGGVEVLWLSGDYVFFSRNYHTAIKMRRAVEN